MINLDNVANINFLMPEFFRWSRKSFSMFGDSFGLDMEGNSYKDTAMNITRYGSIKLSVKYFAVLKDHKENIEYFKNIIIQEHRSNERILFRTSV